MAVTDVDNFIPELWTDELTKAYAKRIFDYRPKRSKAAQMLRDAALGHPEYPEEPEYKKYFKDQMTATELRMKNEMYQHQLDAYRYAIDHISFSNKTDA